MATKSFTARIDRADVEISADGLAAIFNNATTPGTTVKIKKIKMVPRPINPDPTNILGNQGIISLDRISAVSGGTEITADKFDTASADLPSQVKMYRNPDSVTITSTIRRFGDCVSSMTITRAIPLQGMMRAPGILDSNDHTGRTCESHNVWHTDGHPDTEPLVIRAGEGICLTRRAYGVPQAFRFSATIRNLSTGATYRYGDNDAGTTYEIGQASIALINGAGSGVTLQVMIVSMPDVGEDNIPTYRIVRCGTALDYNFPGTSVPVVAHDSANDVSEVAAYRGGFRVRPKVADMGVPVTYHDYQATPITVAVQQTFDNFRRFPGCGPYISLTGNVTLAPDALARGEYEIWPGNVAECGDVDCKITLQAGEGIAIIGGGAGLIETSEQAYLDVEITGYVETEVPTPDELAQAVWTRAGRTLTA